MSPTILEPPENKVEPPERKVDDRETPDVTKGYLEDRGYEIEGERFNGRRPITPEDFIAREELFRAIDAGEIASFKNESAEIGEFEELSVRRGEDNQVIIEVRARADKPNDATRLGVMIDAPVSREQIEEIAATLKAETDSGTVPLNHRGVYRALEEVLSIDSGWTDQIKIANSTLQGTNLGAPMFRAELRNVKLEDINLRGGVLKQALLDGVKACGECPGHGLDLSGARIVNQSDIAAIKSLRGGSINGATISLDSRIKGIGLEGVDARNLSIIDRNGREVKIEQYLKEGEKGNIGVAQRNVLKLFSSIKFDNDTRFDPELGRLLAYCSRQVEQRDNSIKTTEDFVRELKEHQLLRERVSQDDEKMIIELPAEGHRIEASFTKTKNGKDAIELTHRGALPESDERAAWRNYINAAEALPPSKAFDAVLAATREALNDYYYNENYFNGPDGPTVSQVLDTDEDDELIRKRLAELNNIDVSAVETTEDTEAEELPPVPQEQVKKAPAIRLEEYSSIVIDTDKRATLKRYDSDEVLEITGPKEIEDLTESACSELEYETDLSIRMPDQNLLIVEVPELEHANGTRIIWNNPPQRVAETSTIALAAMAENAIPDKESGMIVEFRSKSEDEQFAVDRLRPNAVTFDLRPEAERASDPLDGAYPLDNLDEATLVRAFVENGIDPVDGNAHIYAWNNPLPSDVTTAFKKIGCQQVTASSGKVEGIDIVGNSPELSANTIITAPSNDLIVFAGIGEAGEDRIQGEGVAVEYLYERREEIASRLEKIEEYADRAELVLTENTRVVVSVEDQALQNAVQWIKHRSAGTDVPDPDSPGRIAEPVQEPSALMTLTLNDVKSILISDARITVVNDHDEGLVVERAEFRSWLGSVKGSVESVADGLTDEGLQQLADTGTLEFYIDVNSDRRVQVQVFGNLGEDLESSFRVN